MNLDNFNHGANRSLGRNNNHKNINLSTISISNNWKGLKKNEINKRNILATHLWRLTEKNEFGDLKKNTLVEKKNIIENDSTKNLIQFPDKILKKINELSKKKNYQSLNNTKTQGPFIQQVKELMTIINQPTQSPIKKNNKAKNTINNEYDTLHSRNKSLSPFHQVSNIRTASSSNLKIETLKRYIDNLFPHQKVDLDLDKGSSIKDKGENPKKKDIFEPSYRRKIKNKMHDFKKFKIFVDYNERKQNAENLLAFAKNNQIIMTSIQTKFAENKKERSVENLDEDINVDELIDDKTNNNQTNNNKNNNINNDN